MCKIWNWKRRRLERKVQDACQKLIAYSGADEIKMPMYDYGATHSDQGQVRIRRGGLPYAD